jgi:small GTP-binding protein
MNTLTLKGPIAQVREDLSQTLLMLGEILPAFGEEGKNDRGRLLKNVDDLREMFYIVSVIGEFNAGKSSFINALLGDEILPMGITPTTEVIELVRYGSSKGDAPILRENDQVREWVHPNVGERGVVIVDTPGSGSVFAKHDRIAKDFLSRSDLVIFLLSAKRAFAQTEKSYLEMARDYGKKIILVINQIDLLEAKERKDVEAFVKQQASEMLALTPPLFAVSAKDALKGKRTGLFGLGGTDTSGMDSVRQYLYDTFRRVAPAKQKLYAQLDFGTSVTRKYQKQVQERLDLVTNDERQAVQLREEVDKQANSLRTQLDTSMQELERVFDGMRARGNHFISKYLSLNGTRILRGVNREELNEKFEAEVVGNAISQINNISEDYVNALVDGSRRYWRSIIERLQKMQELLKNQEVSTPDASAYADQRKALQAAIATADRELKAYQEDNLAQNLHKQFSTNLGRFNIGLAVTLASVIFTIFAATPGNVAFGPVAIITVPITVITGSGMLFYLNKMRNDALKQLDESLNKLRQSYRQALEDLTDREKARLLQYGQQTLAPVFNHMEIVKQEAQKQKSQLDEVEKTLQNLRTMLDNLQVEVA